MTERASRFLLFPMGSRGLRAAASGVLILALVSSSACWPFGGRDLPPMTVEALEGRVRVVRGDEVITVKGKFTIQPLDVLETLEGARATFALEGPRDFEIAPSSRAVISSTTEVENKEGDLLAIVREPTRVTFGRVEARSDDGTFRIDNGFASARAASYEGAVELTAPAEPPLEVPAYFEARVAASDLPRSPTPYRLDSSDPWDQVHLEDVVRLDEQLTKLASGLTSQLGRSRPTLEFFRSLSGTQQIAFMRPYLRRSPVDLLIGFTLARNSARRSESPLRGEFKEAFGYHDQGGRWGIVAAIMRVPGDPLLAQLENTILGRVAAAGDDGGDAFVSAGEGSAPPAGDEPPEDDGDDGGQRPREKDDKPKDDDPPPEDECQGTTIECTIEDVINPSPSPSPL